MVCVREKRVHRREREFEYSVYSVLVCTYVQVLCKYQLTME